MDDIQTRIVSAQRDMIINIIKSEYQKRGFNALGTGTDVSVKYQDMIQITINTEEPYLDMELWNLLKDVREKVEEALKIFGYRFDDFGYFFDLWICVFKFSAE